MTGFKFHLQQTFSMTRNSAHHHIHISHAKVEAYVTVRKKLQKHNRFSTNYKAGPQFTGLYAILFFGKCNIKCSSITLVEGKVML